MKQKSESAKSEAKRLKEWKREKALEKAKDIAIDILVASLNGASIFTHIYPTFNSPPVTFLTREDLFTTKKY